MEIPTNLAWATIAEGRRALAGGRGSYPSSEGGDNCPVARLLALLWHSEPSLRNAAALALAGGDGQQAYTPDYGYFTGAVLRGLSGEPPKTASARFACVGGSLRALLDQNASEIRAMSSMNYSFLSSALYLALFSTCRDALNAVRRLHVAPAHAEICRLLWNLSAVAASRRLNGQDVETLAAVAGRALAAMPPGDIPDFWHGLSHRSEARRDAMLPVLPHIENFHAVPYLVEALPCQTPQAAEPLIRCLARLGDPRAIPVLQPFLSHRDRLLRKQAISAVAAIERAGRHSPSSTLVRPVGHPAQSEPDSLLRPLSQSPPNDPPEEMLRAIR